MSDLYFNSFYWEGKEYTVVTQATEKGTDYIVAEGLHAKDIPTENEILVTGSIEDGVLYTGEVQLMKEPREYSEILIGLYLIKDYHCTAI